ncbi:MAG TPA: divalent-cation tolerance protein CutA [Gammaproteobacteria bacterium]|nr:divalent-cation tolerance protein CutA [Gammaproteobacteria bacterium]
MSLISEPPHRLVLCTCPDLETAEQLGMALVAKNLAACVNILPGLTSIYRWQGRLEREPECLLLIKTRQDVLSTLSETLQQLHPYELPEIIAVSVTEGLSAYLDWIDQALDAGPATPEQEDG